MTIMDVLNTQSCRRLMPFVSKEKLYPISTINTGSYEHRDTTLTRESSADWTRDICSIQQKLNISTICIFICLLIITIVSKYNYKLPDRAHCIAYIPYGTQTCLFYYISRGIKKELIIIRCNTVICFMMKKISLSEKMGFQTNQRSYC